MNKTQLKRTIRRETSFTLFSLSKTLFSVYIHVLFLLSAHTYLLLADSVKYSCKYYKITDKLKEKGVLCFLPLFLSFFNSLHHISAHDLPVWLLNGNNLELDPSGKNVSMLLWFLFFTFLKKCDFFQLWSVKLKD